MMVAMFKENQKWQGISSEFAIRSSNGENFVAMFKHSLFPGDTRGWWVPESPAVSLSRYRQTRGNCD
jgi:hypothetical protein